jgi:hypothetical protein
MYELKNITLTLYIPNILDLNRLLLELLKDNQNYYKFKMLLKNSKSNVLLYNFFTDKRGLVLPNSYQEYRRLKLIIKEFEKLFIKELNIKNPMYSHYFKIKIYIDDLKRELNKIDELFYK